MAAAAMCMPWKSHHSAPKFNGEPTQLDYFFEEVEQLSQLCNLSETEKIKWTAHYAPVIDFELWKRAAQDKGANWSEFKAKIYYLYPGSAASERYTIRSLERLCQDAASAPMKSNTQYGMYYRAFLTISRFLKENGRLSDREISSQYFLGLNQSLRQQVVNQLRAENPRHHPEDPYPLDTIDSAARFVLSCNFVSDKDISGQNNNASIVPIQQQSCNILDSETGAHAISEPSVMPQIVHGYGHSFERTSQVKQYSSSRPWSQNDKPRSNRCIFCSSVMHYLSACPEARVMIQNGMCRITTEGRITLPSGDSLIPHSTLGRNLKEQIKSWHEQESHKSITEQSTSPRETRAHIAGRTTLSALPFADVQIPTAYNMPIASAETDRNHNTTGTASTAPILEALYLNSEGCYKYGSSNPSTEFKVRRSDTKFPKDNVNTPHISNTHHGHEQTRGNITYPNASERKDSHCVKPISSYAQSFSHNHGNGQLSSKPAQLKDISHHWKTYTWLAEEARLATSA